MVQADVVQVEAMAAAARQFVVYISASVEEYIHVHVGLFATVRGTFKCLHALASRPEEKH